MTDEEEAVPDYLQQMVLDAVVCKMISRWPVLRATTYSGDGRKAF